MVTRKARDLGSRRSWKISYSPYVTFFLLANCERAFIKLHLCRTIQLVPEYGIMCLQSCFSHVQLFATPVDCSPPVSSVHGILQARILEWVAMLSSRGSFQSRIEPTSLMSSALAVVFLSTSTPWDEKGLSQICKISLNYLKGASQPQAFSHTFLL